MEYLERQQPRQLYVLERLFGLIDQCVDCYEEFERGSLYARVCAVTLLKAKNLGIAAYSLILDGLGQEAGAVIRPFVEYTELLTYFRKFPDEVSAATKDELPPAGKRAKAINGDYQEFREHLNAHASHSSYSAFALGHLREPDSLALRKLQKMQPRVLERNLGDLAVQIWLLLCEGAAGLSLLACSKLNELARESDDLKAEIIRAFDLDRRAEAL